jgi:hypothetical protein
MDNYKKKTPKKHTKSIEMQNPYRLRKFDSERATCNGHALQTLLGCFRMLNFLEIDKHTNWVLFIHPLTYYWCPMLIGYSNN